MGMLGNGNLPGKGHSGKKCDYCNAIIEPEFLNDLPKIGKSPIMGHNRYFCSNRCHHNWNQKYAGWEEKAEESKANNQAKEAELAERRKAKAEADQALADEKAAKLQAEGKPYMAFFAKNSMATALMAILIFAPFMTYFAAGLGIAIAVGVITIGIAGFVGFKYFKEYLRK